MKVGIFSLLTILCFAQLWGDDSRHAEAEPDTCVLLKQKLAKRARPTRCSLFVVRKVRQAAVKLMTAEREHYQWFIEVDGNIHEMKTTLSVTWGANMIDLSTHM